MRIATTLLFLCISAPVWAADCDTNLKPTDTYKELSAKLKCLSDHINALEGSGGDSQKAAIRPKPVAGAQIQEAGGFRMEVDSCTRSGANFSCRLFVTAVSGDQEAQFQIESKAVDSSGTVFRWKGLQTAGQQLKTGSVSRQFIGDVRTGATIFFEGGDQSIVSPLSALQLKIYVQGKFYTMTFRNIMVI
jgi:hypothetical protein